eukprot:CAMPEP_0117532262 /NCGR_PEP_ID=MMETSP0784-20121206/39277_1 /TAXON_ID=39447 /ORGANISM="" /LENGTH=120 /DNA_ID=CAMNT_0005328649 /DNA_START=625 /DNA_END=987 /DNA_ORIENTATION=+
MEVGQMDLQWLLLEEACDDETSVVENCLHVDVVCRSLHVGHPRTRGVREVDLHLPQLLPREVGLQFSHRLVEHKLVAGHDDDVQALGKQLPCELLPDARRATCHEGPRGAVLCLQILDPE